MFSVKSNLVRVLDALATLEHSFNAEFHEDIDFAAAFFDDIGASTTDEAASAQSGSQLGPRAFAWQWLNDLRCVEQTWRSSCSEEKERALQKNNASAVTR
jgi:hypothetical protein